jgi:hypothetical protein
VPASVVQARTDQVVHPGIDDDECLFAAGLFEDDLGQHDRGVGDNALARFEDEFEIRRL